MQLLENNIGRLGEDVRYVAVVHVSESLCVLNALQSGQSLHQPYIRTLWLHLVWSVCLHSNI